MRKLVTTRIRRLPCGDRSKKWIAYIVAALILSGCDTLSKFPSRQPQINTPSNSQQTPRATAQSPTTAQMEAQVRQRINEIRQKQGLSQLRNNEKLARVARNYSQQMAEKNFFSHTSPEGSTMVQRVKSAEIYYLMLGENLFMCTNVPQPVPSAVQGWMDSPGHRKNILRPEYRETGIGVWRKGNSYYITQLFMRSLSLE